MANSHSNSNCLTRISQITRIAPGPGRGHHTTSRDSLSERPREANPMRPEAVEQEKEDLNQVVGGLTALGAICEIREIRVRLLPFRSRPGLNA
jgi:hypothetical protein